VIEFHKLKNYLAINLMYMPVAPAVWLTTKFFGYTTIRKAFQGRSVQFLGRIWGWAVLNMWRYLAERRRARSTRWTG
jgi:hypothetical protein